VLVVAGEEILVQDHLRQRGVPQGDPRCEAFIRDLNADTDLLHLRFSHPAMWDQWGFEAVAPMAISRADVVQEVMDHSAWNCDAGARAAVDEKALARLDVLLGAPERAPGCRDLDLAGLRHDPTQ
jgi:hypothetical protein